MARTLYESVGGFSAISKIVLAFYDKVLDSEKIAPFFADVDMKSLIDHQTKFVCAMLGGPASFTDDQIRLAHRAAAITNAAFDEISALFRQTLQEAALKSNDIDAIMKAFDAKRVLVVSH